MALVLTSLSAAITAGATKIPVTSGTAVRKGFFIRVDSEMMQIDDDSVPTLPLVARGVNGTAAVAHGVLTDAVIGTGDDFPTPLPDETVVSYGVSGAIAVPKSTATVLLTKAGVGVMTLADPSKAQNGMRLLIMSETAQAHTVTNTTGFNGAGTAGDVATFGGAKGDNIALLAVGGQWNVINAKNVTLG